MTMSVTGPRAGFRTISPFVIHAEAPALVDFLKTVFEAEELKRGTAGEAQGFYSEVRIADSIITIAGGSAASHGNVPCALHVFVDDCDAVYRRAIAAGATTLRGAAGEPADRPYGERSALLRDSFGNYWYVATRLPGAPDTYAHGAVMPYAHPRSARQYIGFLSRAFGAEELLVVEQSDRVMHAAVRIGDAVLEMGEPDDRADIQPNGFFLFVDDVEAAYRQVLAAGATSVRPPADVPAGLRSAIVRDPEGNLWWPAQWIG